MKAVQLIRSDPHIRGRIAREFEKRRQQHAERTLSTYSEMLDQETRRPIVSSTAATPPRVTVIIPFYNAQRYARDAIQSAFASAYPETEVIVVNDGSDDPAALEFLGKVEKEFPGLRVIHKPNGGLGDARNAGLKAASGEYIVPLDADNMILPDMLSACSRVLSRRADLAYVTTYFECRRESDSARIPWQLSPIAKPLGAVDPLLLLENTAGDALGMIRRSALEAVGGYSTTVYCFEDWDLWVRFREQGMEGDVLPRVLFVYRLRSDSMSRALDAVTGVRLHQALLRHHGDLVKEQSLAISTLLLHEYWRKWREIAPGVTDAPWDPLKDTIHRVMDNPRLAMRYVAAELGRRLKRRTRRTSTT